MNSKVTIKFFVIMFLSALMIFQASSSYSDSGSPVECELCWSTVGSAGTVDESDISEVGLEGDTVWLNKGSSSSPTEARIRYNIVPFQQDIGYNWLRVGFIDTGQYTRIILKLIEVNLDTGNSTTLKTFDSNSYPPSSVTFTYYPVPSFNIETEIVDFDLGFLSFNFCHNTYYIEAIISKNGADWVGLRFIKLQKGYEA